MKEQYLDAFLNAFDFPDKAKEAIKNTYAMLVALGKAQTLFDCVEDFSTGRCTYNDGIERIRALAKETDTHEYTLILLYLVYAADVLKQRYIARGFDERVWFDSVSDLKYKALDCEGLFGVWGTKDASWHRGFFEMEKFGIGKLQFHPTEFGAKYEKNGIKLQKDSPVLYVHVPRTGGKLDYEGVQRSYTMATEFFQKHFPEKYADRPVAFVFHSWMLFEKHRQVMKPTSNFMRFCNDFDVFSRGEYTDYKNVWRVFYRYYDGDISAMPADTSLQRAYIDIIKNNEKTGWGWGVYIPDFTGESK